MIGPDAYTDAEARATLRNLGAWWRLLGDGLDPAPVAALLAQQVALLADGLPSGPDLVAAAGPAGPLAAVEALGRAAERALGAGGDRADIDPLLGASLALLTRAGRTYAAAGAYASAVGEVAGLFTSAGGVPKLPVDAVSVGPRGLEGDLQLERRQHGRPCQAVCLWSAEVVERLAGEGHPIAPGRAGENVSVRGLDWAAVRTGTRLALGDSLLLEVSLPALPCAKNARWFLDGDFGRMGHVREPGISRMYASVVEVGPLARGDAVRLEPPGA